VLLLALHAAFEDVDFAAHVRRYVDAEIAASAEITPALYKAKTGWLQRVKQFCAYFVVAVVDPNVSRGLNFGVED
jgi:cardiolipin synthase